MRKKILCHDKIYDDLQIMGIQEEANTSERDELGLRPGEHPWLLLPSAFFLLLVVFTEMIEIEHDDDCSKFGR
jgi:hypothetical protein